MASPLTAVAAAPVVMLDAEKLDTCRVAVQAQVHIARLVPADIGS